MTNLTKLEFTALDITGKNYLPWVLDAEIHLDAKGLGNVIVQGNEATNQDKAKAMIFLRHHIHEGLKAEYLTVKDPLELWRNLKERYDHQKMVILPKARYEWIHLRLQDFKTTSEYNSAVFKISSQLKLCGEKITDEDLLEKTFSTFHASNMLLSQQYREKGFKKYSELISCLLVAEQNNELLMKNHENRPTGSAPFPEANASMRNNYRFNGRGWGHGQGRNRGRERGRGRGYGNYRYYGGGSNKYNPNNHQKRKSNEGNIKDKNPSKVVENGCFRCGMKGHWARTCRTPEHLAKLYEASRKRSANNVEANLFFQDDDVETHKNDDVDAHKNDDINELDDNNDLDALMHLDVADFY